LALLGQLVRLARKVCKVSSGQRALREQQGRRARLAQPGRLVLMD